MSTFFLYLAGIFFIVSVAGLTQHKYLNKQCNEVKDQIDVYYKRERYMNDLLNIDQLTLGEMQTLYKSGDEIITISEEHALKNRALFSQLNLTKAQFIIENAIKKKDWLQDAEKFIARTDNSITFNTAAFKKITQKISDLLNQMPDAFTDSPIHNRLKQKNFEILNSAPIPSVPETIKSTKSPSLTPGQIVTNAEMIDISYLKKILNASKPVAALRTRSERSATGFLIAPQLFLTTNTALPNPAEARKATITLHYQNDENDMLETTKILDLNPQKLFLTDEKLNYSLVGVENEDNVAKTEPAKLTLQPVLDTDNIIIIHHPENKSQHVSFFNTKLTGFAGDFINYSAHTENGSVGGPIFDNNWRVIAMHQSRYSNDNNDNDASPIQAKEGVKITSIIKNLQEKNIKLSRKQQEYLQKHLFRKDNGMIAD